MAASRRPEPRPSGENVSVRQPQYRQDAYPSPTLVDDNQCTGSQVDVMLHQGCDYYIFQKLRQYSLPTNLKYARSGRVGQRQNRAEVQIVGKHDMFVFYCPLHDGPVARAWIPYRGPMDCLPSVVIQNGNPIRRQIHVNHELDAHVRASGTSRSSTLHAA